MNKDFNFPARARAGGWHLVGSITVTVAVAALVLGFWFPGPFQTLAGGRELLLLIMAVDVVLGPLLTFAIYDMRKGSKHLARDIATIVLLQCIALVYGIHTAYLARPVALVFEYDRFRVISASDVVEAELHKALPEYRVLPLNGPQTIAIRKTTAGPERNDALMTAALSGVDTSQRPQFWIPYGLNERGAAYLAARPLRRLQDQYPGGASTINSFLTEQSLSSESLKFLPVRARNDAVAVLKEDGSIAGFLPFDGYF